MGEETFLNGQILFIELVLSRQMLTLAQLTTTGELASRMLGAAEPWSVLLEIGS